MRVRPNRGDRLVEGRTACACAHAVPVNCHDRLHETQHPANISMKIYSICYMSALQAPPRPLAVNEGKSVIFTLEPFWLEPYWRELLLDNLTFHYDFNVKAPEHCEGTVTTLDDGQHLCTNSIALNITNYDQYDDDLPEEVEIDRDIFAGAPEVQVYYLVDVNRPRQLEVKGGSITIHDAKTSVESEILKYDLTAGYQPTEDLPAVTETQDEGEDTSEEQGGIDNFENHRPSKSKEREPTKGEMHDKNVKTDVKSSEAKTTTEEPQVEHEEEHGDDDNELTTTMVTPKTTGEQVYVKTEADDDEEVEEDKKKEDDITEADGSHETEEITESTAKADDDSVEANAKHEEKMEKEGDNEEEEESSEQHDEDDDTETDEDEKEKDNDEVTCCSNNHSKD
ncbi:unnamed protein product [Haemonchus placei]|uniref:Mitotic apparatus protein p62 n=1 Tax=Haemonchus placei TaxID=6290 RepID=A0A0N4W5N6_HAEPC|nr:unnamed protein product [Haemonchus placei]